MFRRGMDRIQLDSETSGKEAIWVRMEKLERRLRWERLAYVLLAGSLFGAGWLSIQGSSRVRTVEAERFVLRGADGKARAELDTLKGAPALSFRDGSGVRRLAVEVEADGMPVIWLFDENEQGLASISLAGGKYPSLEFWDGKDTGPKLSAGVTERGEAYVHVYDKEKQKYWNAP